MAIQVYAEASRQLPRDDADASVACSTGCSPKEPRRTEASRRHILIMSPWGERESSNLQDGRPSSELCSVFEGRRCRREVQALLKRSNQAIAPSVHETWGCSSDEDDINMGILS